MGFVTLGENMELAEIHQAMSNPNVRKMLDLIATTEGTTKNGYNTAFGGGRFDNLGAHPNVRSGFTQTDGKQNTTTAAGRYQFLKPTWDGLAKQYGFRDFSPEAQDMGAIALLAQNGALKDVMNGDFQTAIQKSGKTWASLPSSTYAQGKKSWDFVNQKLGQSTSNDTTAPNFVDLNSLGYKQSASVQQPNFVDLKTIGYQESAQNPPQNQPNFTDLRSLGYQG